MSAQTGSSWIVDSKKSLSTQARRCSDGGGPITSHLFRFLGLGERARRPRPLVRFSLISYPKSEGANLSFAEVMEIPSTKHHPAIISYPFATPALFIRFQEKDGSIIWTLGGRRNNFKLLNFNFCFQHHVRILEESSNHITISLFNDAANNFKQTDNHSSALFIVINMADMTARATHIWDRPDGELTQVRKRSTPFKRERACRLE